MVYEWLKEIAASGRARRARGGAADVVSVEVGVLGLVLKFIVVIVIYLI